MSTGGGSSSAFRFPLRSVGGLGSASAADAKEDEDASWRDGGAVSEAQGRARSVHDVERMLMPKLLTDAGAGLLGIVGRPGRSQRGFGGLADARVN